MPPMSHEFRDSRDRSGLARARARERPHDRGRPGEKAASDVTHDGDNINLPGADLGCRIPTHPACAERPQLATCRSWIASHLSDLTELLECAEREGWFG